MRDPKELDLFMTRRRLRKCRRCGHFPCPHCYTWCDVMAYGPRLAAPLEPPLGANISIDLWHKMVALVNHVNDEKDQKEDVSEPICPCAEEFACLSTYSDWACNKEVFEIFDGLCNEFATRGVKIVGSYTTEDGRLVAVGTWKDEP